jgi:hypothetical protein
MYELPGTNNIGVVKFDGKSDCADWLDEMHSSPNPSNAYSFECGSNCKAPTTDVGLYHCQDTFD